MRYISTRGKADPKAFKDILLEGLASDGGLYMPETYPQMDLNSLKGASYTDVALSVLAPFADDVPFWVLRNIVTETYTADNFCSRDIAPLKWLEPGLALLQLANGPTLAFKDLALQPLAALMEYALEEKSENLNILGATSGDTGSAAAYAVRGKECLRLFMLSPYGRMSRFQQMQMYTLNEPNIHNLVVNGTFDDCQAVVKEVNADADFKKQYKLGAVNSINWARIAAQVVYYVYAYLKAAKRVGDKVVFAVPSGNFGNALSAYIAKRMGLPIAIVVCTNENDVLDEFFRTGIYRVRKGVEVKVTSSPSMDIAAASNFERLIFDLVERDPRVVIAAWEELSKNGEFDFGQLDAGAPYDITSSSTTEEEVLDTIRKVHDKYKIIIDPHTAVAMKIGEDYRQFGYPVVVAETAQPAKFADTIREALGFEAPVPAGYEGLADLPEHTTRIDPDAAAVKEFIAAHVN